MRTMSYYGSESYIRELLSGIAFYKFVEELLDDFDNKKEEIAKKISDTVKYVFRKDNITINYAGNKESFEKVKALVSNLQRKMNEPVDFKESFDGWTLKRTKRMKASLLQVRFSMWHVVVITRTAQMNIRR